LFSSFDRSISNYCSVDSSQWMEAVKLNDGKLTIVPPHQVDYYKQAMDNVVSLARVIREPYTHLPIGIVKVDLTPKGFESILSSVTLSQNSELYILDQEGNLLYSKSESDETM